MDGRDHIRGMQCSGEKRFGGKPEWFSRRSKAISKIAQKNAIHSAARHVSSRKPLFSRYFLVLNLWRRKNVKQNASRWMEGHRSDGADRTRQRVRCIDRKVWQGQMRIISGPLDQGMDSQDLSMGR